MGSVLKEKLLNKKKEEIDASAALKDKLIALYFSAHWCPPCRAFTPRLKQFYEKLRSAGKEIEIVFVSWDRSEDDMWHYFTESHADYLALPYDSKLREELGKTYEVSGIPWLTVLNDDGTAARNEADEDMGEPGTEVECFEKWVAAKSK